MIYYVNNKKLIKKDITAIDLVLSLVDKDTSVKLLASSFAKEPTKITGWNKIDHKRNFAVVKFDKQFTEYDAKIIDKNLNDNQYVLFNNGKYDILIMNLDKGLSKDDYKNFVVNTCRGLRVKVLPGISTINKAVKIDKITSKDIISKNKDGKPYHVDAESISNSLNSSKKQEPAKDNVSTDNQKEPALHLVQSDDESADDSTENNDNQADVKQTADKPKLYFVQNKKLVKKDITPVELIDSLDKDSDVKLLASSFATEPTKITGWKKISHKRNFACVNFDDRMLSYVTMVVEDNFRSIDYALIKVDKAHDLLILDLDKELNEQEYKQFVSYLSYDIDVNISGNTSINKAVKLGEAKIIELNKDKKPIHVTDDQITKPNNRDAKQNQETVKAEDKQAASTDEKHQEAPADDSKDDSKDNEKDNETSIITVGPIYFTKGTDKKVIKQENASAVKMINDAINNGENIKVLSSKATNLGTYYDYGSSFPQRDFAVINFNLTDLSKIKKMLKADFESSRYIVFMSSHSKGRLILDLNRNLSNYQYNNFARNLTRTLGIKALPSSFEIDKPVIISNVQKDDVIKANIVKEAFPVTEAMTTQDNSLDLDDNPELKKKLVGLGLYNLFDFENNPATGETEMIFADVSKNHNLCPKSMNAYYKLLDNVRYAWLIAIGNPTKQSKLPVHVVYQILNAFEMWIQPTTPDNDINPKTLPPYYMDYDKKIYQFEPSVINTMIHHLLPDLNKDSEFKAFRNHIGDWLAVPKVPDLLKPENHHNLLALKSGVFNLSTKKFIGYNFDMVILRKLNVDYKMSALLQEPHFGAGGWWSLTKFFNEATQGKKNRIRLLWQGLLAAMQGAYWLKQMLLIVSVAPNTGKSTYLDIVRNICKGGTASVSIDSLTPEMCASIVGKFVILGDELKSNRPIQLSGVFKRLIANNPMDIHVLNKMYYSMPLNVFVMQACNGFPRFANSDSTGDNQAVFDRIRAIIFHHTYKKTAKNKKVIDEYVKSPKLAEWVVNYILMNDDIRLDDGLQPTDESKDLLADQQIDEDPVLSFKADVLDERLIADNYAYIPKSTMYNLFVNYYHHNFGRRDRPSMHAFIKQLKLKAPEWVIKHGIMKEKYYVNPLNQATYLDKPYFLDPDTIFKDARGNDLPDDLVRKMKKALPKQEKLFKSYHELFPEYFQKPGAANDPNAQSLYDDLIHEYEGEAGNIAARTLTEKQQMKTEAIYSWNTLWYVNTKAIDKINNQIKNWNHYQQAYYALYNDYGAAHNKPSFPDNSITLTLHDVLQALPGLIDDYLSRHGSFDNQNSLKDYMDVYSLYLN